MGSLRRQSLLMTAATLALFMAIGAGISHYVMDRSMREFEGRDAAHTLDRINILIDLQLLSMRKQAADYSIWDTTYDFMESADPGYVKQNYSKAILDNLDIDQVFLIRTDGRIAIALFRANQIAPGATGIRYVADAGPTLLSDRILAERAKSAEPKIAGILNVDGKMYVYGISAILTNDGTGPTRGDVVFIRELDHKRMSLLKRLAQEEFSLVIPAAQADRIEIGDDRIASAKTVRDTLGNPVAAIVVDQPRPLKSLVTTTRNIISANALILTLIALLFVYLMFDRLVLRKIDALVRNIFSVRQVGAIGNRLPAIGDQDIDRISSEVNHMLEDLSNSHTRLQHEAFHDHLTGLGNRRLLLKELEDAFRAVKNRQIECFTLLLMDLDDFKDINDLYGHLAGDQVIKVIAERLSSCTRGPDIPVRLGGDEFAVLIWDSRPQASERHAEILLDAITRPIVWDGITLGVKASIGIVTADASADPGSIPIDWLRKADIAMYASKNRTKNGYLVFHTDLESSIGERKRMESELSMMIAEDASEIWMQPILKNDDGSLFALEALSRWFHPTLGEIAPLTFIRMAEETKLIDRLDRSVIRRCCALISGLRLRHPDLYLCINVSALTLMEPDFSAFVARQFRLHSIPEGALMLEITETVLASDEAALLNGIRAIRQLGVRFLIDDFGTGYSSLSRLNALPLDFLKIDGSFLAALDSGQDTICKTIIRMAHSLDMQVIAEGVETESQLRRLSELKCDYVQGYYYAKPMNPQQLERYLRSI